MTLERVEQKIDDLTASVSDVRVKVEGIATKMDILVGPDGTDGVVKEHHQRLKSLEDRKLYESGFFGAAGVAAGMAFHWVVGKLAGWH